jgi:hypothetical protein
VRLTVDIQWRKTLFCVREDVKLAKACLDFFFGCVGDFHIAPISRIIKFMPGMQCEFSKPNNKITGRAIAGLGSNKSHSFRRDGRIIEYRSSDTSYHIDIRRYIFCTDLFYAVYFLDTELNPCFINSHNKLNLLIGL